MSEEIPEELKAEYRKTVPGKLSSLKQLIDLVVEDASEERLKDLRFAVHKLAGSSGMYGYIKVSDLCKKFELELVKSLEEKTLFTGEHYMKEIQEEFKKAS
jgi:HPt (histidine-containing phosphotransfer) domain-containing protein